MVLSHFVQAPTAPALIIFIEPIHGWADTGAGHTCAGEVGALLSRQPFLELQVLHLSRILSQFLCPRLMEPHRAGITLLGSRCTEKDGEMREGELGKERQTEAVQ